MQREEEEECWQFGVKQSVSPNVSLHMCVDSSSSNLKKARVCVCVCRQLQQLFEWLL